MFIAEKMLEFPSEGFRYCAIYSADPSGVIKNTVALFLQG